MQSSKFFFCSENQGSQFGEEVYSVNEKTYKLSSKGDLSQWGGLTEWLNRAYRTDESDHANS